MRPFTPLIRQRPVPSSTKKGPTTAIKPILRKTLDNRSSDDAGLDSQQSPTKRRKVIFDDVRNITHEFGVKTTDEVKADVRAALEDHIRGHDGAYDSLKEMFSKEKRRYLSPMADEEENDDEQPKPQELRTYMVALTSCVPLVKDKACNGLVRAILACSWLGRDDEFTRIYIQFLAALVSAQGSYLSTVLTMLVEKFSWVRPSDWSVPDLPQVSRQTMRARLHLALRHMLQMFPAASDALCVVLGSRFPFMDDSKRVHMAFVNNLLKLRGYAPGLETDILDLIVHRLVKIDVQMQVDLEDLDDEIGAAVAYSLKDASRTGWWEEEKEGDESEGEDDDDTESVVASDDSLYDEDVVRIRSVKGSVEKMDAMLDTLFGFYSPHFADPSSDEAFEYYSVLLQQFASVILPTWKSRHTQFLLFHFGQKSDRLLDAFCGTCISIAFQPSQPNAMRQAATLYLSSFVARAALMPAELVRDIFATLTHHLGVYFKAYEANCRGPDLKRYYAYYALFQGIIYIFCFRWKELVVSTSGSMVDPDDAASYAGQELEWVPNCREVLLSNVHSKMNPLKVCSPIIVEEFAKLSHRLNFLYIFPRVNSNKRLRLSQFLSGTYGTGGALRDSGVSTQDESYHQLDPYFPFDPYQLPVSKRWMDDDYMNWKAFPGLNADGDDDEDEGNSSSEEEGQEGGGKMAEDTATESESEED